MDGTANDAYVTSTGTKSPAKRKHIEASDELPYLSSDPPRQEQECNSKFHYKPTTREEWVAATDVPQMPNLSSKDADDTNASNCMQLTPLELLEKLESHVCPKEDVSASTVRHIVRQLKSSLVTQRNELTRNCADIIKLSEKMLAWHADISGACNMNQFCIELHQLGEKLYGRTVTERTQRMHNSIQHDANGYVSSARKCISSSRLDPCLENVTAKRQVTKMGHRNFAAVLEKSFLFNRTDIAPKCGGSRSTVRSSPLLAGIRVFCQ